MKALTLILLFILPVKIYAQLTIGATSTIRVNGQMVVNGSVRNLSTNAQLATAEVSLSGLDQTITTNTPVEVQTLKVNGGGIKTLQGNWRVTENLSLTSGIINVSPTGKLTYTGSEALQGSTTSFIQGLLFIQGSGRLVFPTGVNTTFAPAIVENYAGGNELGLQVISGDPAVALPPGIDAYFSDHYWQFSQAPGSPVSLSINGANTFIAGATPLILEAASPGAISSPLTSTLGADFLTSAQSASQPLLAIGKSPEFRLFVHDLITPFTQDEINDRLYIENLEMTTANSIKLLDRWGVVVGEWENYRNDGQDDFQKFSPGNYICVVEYSVPGSAEKSVVKGIVTILKSN